MLYYVNNSEPVTIFAGGGSLSHSGTPEIVDAVLATITYENGATSTWIQGDLQRNEFASKFFLQMFQPGAAVSLHNRFHDGLLTRDREEPESWSVEDDLPGEDAEGTAQELEEFIASVSAGKQPEIGASVRDGVRATAVILAAFESVRSGQQQEIAF